MHVDCDWNFGIATVESRCHAGINNILYEIQTHKSPKITLLGQNTTCEFGTVTETAEMEDGGVCVGRGGGGFGNKMAAITWSQMRYFTRIIICQ